MCWPVLRNTRSTDVQLERETLQREGLELEKVDRELARAVGSVFQSAGSLPLAYMHIYTFTQ